MTEITQDKILEMAKVGVLFGHRKSKTHPSMKSYVAHNRNELELLSPDVLSSKLSNAAAFLKEVVSHGGIMLCVGTTAPAREVVAKFAENRGWPFVVQRWLGGTLTNFKVIRERIDYYLDLRAKRERGDFQRYTKKEKLEVDRLISKMSQSFETIVSLTTLPDALFVVDPLRNETAILEAKKLGIPVLAILDTNDNEEMADYPIHGNDHNKTSIEWLIGELQKDI